MIEKLEEVLSAAGLFAGPDLQEVGLGPLALVLAVSLATSLFISFLYLQFYGGRETGSQIYRTFPLLGPAITAIFVCLQFSLPLSLGLLGALSIVRFRTPIKEPEEIGFLMLVIASSLASATFNLGFLGLFLLFTIAALLISPLLFGAFHRGREAGALVLTLDESDLAKKQAEIESAIGKTASRVRLESMTRNGERMVLTFAFRAMRRDRVPELNQRLEKIMTSRDYTLIFGRGTT